MLGYARLAAVGAVPCQRRTAELVNGAAKKLGSPLALDLGSNALPPDGDVVRRRVLDAEILRRSAWAPVRDHVLDLRAHVLVYGNLGRIERLRGLHVRGHVGHIA